MASSDWEDLINEAPWQSPAAAERTSPTQAPSNEANAQHGDTEDGEARAAMHAAAAAFSRSVIKPLCLCTNQKHTRLGVGHETGYLVFRLVPTEAAEDLQQNNEDVELLEPSLSCSREQIASLLRQRRAGQRATHHLVLDPLYNTTSERFSTLFRRMHHGTDSVSHDAELTRNTACDAAAQEPQELDMLLSYTSTTLSQMRIFDEHHGTRGDRTPHDIQDSEEDDDEEDDDVRHVGFSGGGVGAMALLYEQHCLAVVGGGPRPMSAPHTILLLHNGSLLQSLTLSAPVLRLFLDARLLFVCTAHELRIYTNPMEPEWTACGFQMSFTPSPTPSTSTTIRSGSCNREGAQPTASVPQGGQLADPSLAQPDLEKKDDDSNEEMSGGTASPVRRSTSTTAETRRSLSTAASFACAPHTTQTGSHTWMPCVMDYAHSCLLLRHAHSPCGFTLLQYSTRTEAAAAADAAAAATDAASGLSGQVRLRLCELGSCPAAHRNPLNNLALCMSAAAALTTTIAKCGTLTSSSTRTPILPPPQQQEGGGDGSMSCSAVAHATVMVAACSAYATRITLWVLLRAREGEAGSTAQDVPTGRAETATTARFVLLREFRVGFRVPPATMLLQRATHNAQEQGIYHLQFLQDGRFLFCVRHNRMLVFSLGDEAGGQNSTTTANNGGGSSYNAKDVCHDQPQATQNKHSMLLAVNKVLPVQLSLASYTRQDWASCEAALPMHDAVLYPRWLLLYKQDKAAAAIATARALASNEVHEPHTESHSNSSSRMVVGVVKGTQGWLGRMSRYVNRVYRGTGEQASDATSGSSITSDALRANSARTDGEEEKAAVVEPVCTSEALTQFAPCLLIWEQDKDRNDRARAERRTEADAVLPYASHITTNTSTLTKHGHVPRLYDKDGKIVLHCVSCEGGYTTIRLYKDRGDIYCAPGVPFTLQ